MAPVTQLVAGDSKEVMVLARSRVVQRRSRRFRRCSRASSSSVPFSW